MGAAAADLEARQLRILGRITDLELAAQQHRLEALSISAAPSENGEADAGATEARLSALLAARGVRDFAFRRVPADYYDRSLEERRGLLRAGSVAQLCKSIVMVLYLCIGLYCPWLQSHKAKASEATLPRSFSLPPRVLPLLPGRTLASEGVAIGGEGLAIGGGQQHSGGDGGALMATSASFVPPRRTGAAAMEDGASRDGMFMVEIKVEGFASKDSSGRKAYTKGHVFKWDVEFGSMTLDLLLESLAAELNLSTDQTPTVWFYDKRLKEDARLVDEIQMVDLFEMYKEEMRCKVVVRVFDRASCVEPEFDALEPLCELPPTNADGL